ncbi:MAG: hypothetical protein M3R50_08815 [Bacteroidota bacterium]|nr:hypothetical protein [Bacteroidota bacterium]
MLLRAKIVFDYSGSPDIKLSSDGKDWNIFAMEWSFISSWTTNREILVHEL